MDPSGLADPLAVTGSLEHLSQGRSSSVDKKQREEYYEDKVRGMHKLYLVRKIGRDA